jgi:cell shape-determining protein MreD
MFASFFQSSLVRVIPLGVVLLALQRTIFVEVQPAGVILQIMMIMTAAAGVAGGSERGAMVGFVFGVMFDLAEGTPLGSTALAFTLAGVISGLLPLIAADPHWWLESIFTALGSAAGVAAVPVVRVFIGESEPFESQLGLVVLVMAVTGAVASPLLVPFARWVLKLRRPEWKQPVGEPGL